ncbi:MAG TPA: extracellular solute-binding protein [Chloroflexota bacterium]|nr:extracellular solute-binding protein [Chloroflexota bacterium]
MVTRKQFLHTAAGLIGASVLAACGGGASTASPAAGAAPASTPKPATNGTTASSSGATPTRAPMAAQGKGKVDLTWEVSQGDAWMKASVATLPALLDKVPAIGKVTVEPTPGDWENKLVASMVAGTAPDVFDMWGDIIPPFVERGQVVDVQPLVNRDYKAADLQDFYDWQWRDFVLPWLNNIRFGMPRYVNMMFTWYRKDMFDKAGVKYPSLDWSHVDYADAANKLTAKDSSGKVTTFGLAYPAWSWDRYWYKPTIWGGHTVDPNDNTKAAFDSEQSLAAFEWSRKLMWDDKAMLPPLEIQNQSFLLHFPTGIMAMAEDGIYPFEMDDQIQGKFEWAYMHVPKGPTGVRKVLGTTDGTAIWKGTKAQDEAWELQKWVAGPDYQLAIVQATGRVPVRHSVLAKWLDIAVKTRPNLKNANLNVALEAMQMGYPGAREFYKDNNAAQEIIVPALQKVFVTGGAPVTYMKQIATQVTNAEKNGAR